MTDPDYIRKGTELADGFTWNDLRELGSHHSWIGIVKEKEEPANTWFHYEDPIIRNALAAQLRLQAQSNPHIVFNISVVDSASFVEMLIYNPNGDEEAQPLRFVANETEESMACIKVIVDSGELK